MPAQPSVLGQLFKTKAHNYILAVTRSKFPNVHNYNGPLFQKTPQYFIQFTEAIATGIAVGTPLINFTTSCKNMAF